MTYTTMNATPTADSRAPWWSLLLVQRIRLPRTTGRRTLATHTVIEASQWPPWTLNAYNGGDSTAIVTRRRRRTTIGSRRRTSGDSRRSGDWQLAQIIGPLDHQRAAVAVNSTWEHASRGVMPRAAKGVILAEHYRLECYLDREVLLTAGGQPIGGRGSAGETTA